MRKVFHSFRTNAKVVSIVLTRCEKCFTFFLQMRNVFHFFLTNAKSVSFFSTKSEKCFIYFDKIRRSIVSTKCKKCFTCFLQNLKSVSIFLIISFFVRMQKQSGIFHLCTIFLVFFYNMCGNFN